MPHAAGAQRELADCYRPGPSPPVSSRGVSAPSEDGLWSRPLACDFRRLRFSRSASFRRSRRESFTSVAVFSSRLARSSLMQACWIRCGSNRDRPEVSPTGRCTGTKIMGFVVPRSSTPQNRPRASTIRAREPDRARPRRPALIFAHFGPFPAPPRACAGGVLVARTARLRGPLGPIPPIPARCRSSVVEHSIGNGEVDSSILSGSTSLFNDLAHSGFPNSPSV